MPTLLETPRLRLREFDDATEMARAVLAHGLRTLRVPRVVGLAWPENVASQRVLEKIGMQRRGSEVHYGRSMHVYVAQ